MSKRLITEGISGEVAANIINGNATELYNGDDVVAADSKNTPIDADVMAIQDSAASNIKKKVTWANIKATIKTYFDTIYGAKSAVELNTNKVGITSQQAADITTNNAKVGITSQQAVDITVNNNKISATGNELEPEDINTLAKLNSIVADATLVDNPTPNATHTGDVTGSEELTISNNAVTTDKIANDAVTDDKVANSDKYKTHAIIIYCSDETSDLEAGVAKVTFKLPYAITLTEVRANVTNAPSGSLLTVDINNNGVSILSTKLTIDADETSSVTANTAPVISNPVLASDDTISIDLDSIGAISSGKGLAVELIGII